MHVHTTHRCTHALTHLDIIDIDDAAYLRADLQGLLQGFTVAGHYNRGVEVTVQQGLGHAQDLPT